MNIANIDEVKRLINERTKLEAEIKEFSEILESPHKLTLGYVDYGRYTFYDTGGLVAYQLNMEKEDIEALIETRNHKIADIEKRLGEL